MYFGCENSALQRNQSAGSQEPSPHHEAARFPFGHGASTSSVPCRRWGEMADHQSPPSGRGDGKMGLTCGQPFYPSTILRNFSSSESCRQSVCLRAGLKIPGRAVFVLKLDGEARRDTILAGDDVRRLKLKTYFRDSSPRLLQIKQATLNRQRSTARGLQRSKVRGQRSEVKGMGWGTATPFTRPHG